MNVTMADFSPMSSVNELDPEDEGFALTSLEKWWRDRAVFLESRGYRLRPRFMPGWKPSWKGRDLDPFFCEDGLRHLVSTYQRIELGVETY